METTPTIYVDEYGTVTVGEHPINLIGYTYKVFEYLYHHSGQIVTKAELYYLIYRQLEKIPNVDDEQYEKPSAWEGTIDTVIWRIRQSIEPLKVEGEEPRYLLTVNKKGVKLVNCRE